jgi:hypothetical protein
VAKLRSRRSPGRNAKIEEKLKKDETPVVYPLPNRIGAGDVEKNQIKIYNPFLA